MAYRWKLPEFNAGFVDPEGVRNTMLRKAEIDRAANDMRGYSSDIRQNPILAQSASMAMRGYQPNAAMGNIGERSQNEARYQQLQNELNQIDTQIAEVKKRYPGITNEREWRIAAKRAEIGDMSAYDNMMARGRDASQGVTGVENSLYNVLKLGWGLKTNKDEDAQITLANMNTELQKAEEWSQKTGQPLPRVYYEVKNAVDEYYAKHKNGGTGGDLVRNAEEAINKLNSMVAEGNFPKEEYDKYYNWVKQNPNSEFAKPLGDWLVANKGKTNEARAAAAAQAKRVTAKFNEIQGKPAEDQATLVNQLSPADKRAFERKYKWDKATGYSKR